MNVKNTTLKATVIIKYQCVEWKGDTHVTISTNHVALPELYL